MPVIEEEVKLGQMLALPVLPVFQFFHFPLLIFPSASTYESRASQEYCSARGDFHSFLTVALVFSVVRSSGLFR